MGRPNEIEIRPTRLRCVENDHRYVDDIEWVGIYLEELSQPDWRPVTQSVTCRYCNSSVEAV